MKTLKITLTSLFATLACTGIIYAATTVGTNISTTGTIIGSGANTLYGATSIGGAITATSTLDVSGLTTLGNASTTLLSVSGNLDFATASSTGIVKFSQINSDTGAISFGDENLSTTGNLTVNTDKFFVNATTGNVGIGTSTPTSAFEAVGTATFTGAESLTNTTLTSGSSWTETGDFSLTADTAVYTDSTGVGELVQSSGVMAKAIVGSVYYELTFTLSTVSGDGAAYIEATNGLVDTDIALWDTSSPIAGTWTKTFKTKASPSDLRISVISTSGAFTLDNISLKQSVANFDGSIVFDGDSREKVLITDSTELAKKIVFNTIDNPYGGNDFYSLLVQTNTPSNTAMMPLIVLGGLDSITDQLTYGGEIHSGAAAFISNVAHPDSTTGIASTVIKDYTGATMTNPVQTGMLGKYQLNKGDLNLNFDTPVSGVQGIFYTGGSDTKGADQATGIVGRLLINSGTNDTIDLGAALWAMDSTTNSTDLTVGTGLFVASQTGGVANYGIILDGNSGAAAATSGGSIAFGPNRDSLIYDSAAFGLSLQPGAGSTNDFTLFDSGANNPVLAIPTGTSDFVIGKDVVYSNMARTYLTGRITNGRTGGNVYGVTCTDTGDASAGALTITPYISYIQVTNNDVDGCVITLSETGAAAGERAEIWNVSANSISIADSDGVQEVASSGTITINQWERAVIRYASSGTWMVTQ